VRVLVLELEDLAFDLDRVGLEVILGERVVSGERTAEERDSADHECPPEPPP
jgi:hypothetical protein